MALQAVERIMARRQIAAMIQSDPVDITLFRTSRIPDGAGGYTKGSPAPLPPQTVTIIPFKRRMAEFLVNTELGSVPDLPYVVLGYNTLDIKRGDTFTWNGEKFEVQTVEILEREVRIAAHVDYFGGASNG